MARRRAAGLRGELGLRAVAGVVLGNVAAAVFLALGVTAEEALGLTPLVFAIIGILILVSMTSFLEGIAMLPQAGGSSGFARRGFNELVSFLTAWALLLDYLIVIAMSAFFAAHYIGSLPGLGQIVGSPHDVALSVLLIVAVGLVGARRLQISALLSALIGLTALGSLMMLAALGVVLVLDVDALTRTVELGTTPTWSGLAFALPVAMVGFIGLEVVANLSSELREGSRRRLPPVLTRSVLVAVLLLVTMSAVALSVMPVTGSGAGASTALSRTGDAGFVDRPMVGVIVEMGMGAAAEQVSLVLVCLLAVMVLFVVANTSVLGMSRLLYSMSQHRQMPSLLGRVDRARGAPAMAVLVLICMAAGLLLVTETLRNSALALAQLYAFGSSFSLMVASAAIIRLRFTEPDLPRPYRAGVNVRLRGREVSLLSVAGLLGAAVVWVLVIATHDAARVLGLIWMVGGFVAYGTYRLTHGHTLVDRVEPRREEEMKLETRTYRRILLAVRPEPGRLYGEGDAEVAALARKLLDVPDGEIAVMLVHELPLTKPLSAPLGEVEQVTAARLSRLRSATDKLGVRLTSTITRARAAGRAICQEAARREADAIVIATGAKPRTGDAIFGKSVSYVLRHAPCDVVILRFPEASLAAVDSGVAASLRRGRRRSARAAIQGKE